MGWEHLTAPAALQSRAGHHGGHAMDADTLQADIARLRALLERCDDAEPSPDTDIARAIFADLLASRLRRLESASNGRAT